MIASNNESWNVSLRRSNRHLAFWTAGWLLTMALASFGPALIWDQHTGITIAAVLLNLAIGVGMVLANKDYIRSLDELQQKIHLEAMSLTLGVALIAGLAWSNLDIGNVISFDAEIAHVVLLMGLTYIVTVWVLTRKYR